MTTGCKASCTIIVFAGLLFTGCKKELAGFEIKHFEAATNFQGDAEGRKVINLDYKNAIEEGFVIPTVRQSSNGMFHCSFMIKNKGADPARYFYKIYYQNKSYKWPEREKNMFTWKQHQFASENFYGSWEQTDSTFISTGIIPADNNFHFIQSSIRIVGNPRSEEKYFGEKLKHGGPDSLLVQKFVADIKKSEEWLKSVKEKALKNNMELEDQILDDALYMASKSSNKVHDNKWKRNPRVGDYEFLLVVCTEDVFKDSLIPLAVRNISKKSEDGFMNPFYYFKFGKGRDFEKLRILESNDIISVKAKPQLEQGIFIDLPSPRVQSREHYNSLCSDSEEHFRNANFAQFFHYDFGKSMRNVEAAFNVNSALFTKERYDSLAGVPDSLRIDMRISSSKCPCETVYVDTSDNSIVIKNPGGKGLKENVGIATRHGFTYGKFKAKVKLTEILNERDIWNGITNAVWLVMQSNESWNDLRTCTNNGYIPKEYFSEDAPRVPTLSYSEIDFEIVKASEHWPALSYRGKGVAPEPLSRHGEIVVACTNWDMACPDPPNFNVGAQSFLKDGAEYVFHRWTHWYQALTSKVSVLDDELFSGDYYYFEIDWRPESITWRIGPKENELRTIAVVDNSISSIPGNQMLLVITQEYHISEWWPTAPYAQENIPAPKLDLTGRIFEITIE